MAVLATVFMTGFASCDEGGEPEEVTVCANNTLIPTVLIKVVFPDIFELVSKTYMFVLTL
jgi:hypothetical protein